MSKYELMLGGGIYQFPREPRSKRQKWAHPLRDMIPWDQTYDDALISEQHQEGASMAADALRFLKARTEELPAKLREFLPAVRKAKLESLMESARQQVAKAVERLRKRNPFYPSSREEQDRALLALSEPPAAEGMEAVLRELRHQEIRRGLEAQSRGERVRVLDETMKRGNLDFLHAALSAPFEMVEPEALARLRLAWAYDRHPSIKILFAEAEQVAQAGDRLALEVERTAQLLEQRALAAAAEAA